MAEVSTRRQGPLDALAGIGRGRTGIHAASPRAKLLLRCHPDSAALAGTAFGVTPPLTACRAAVAGERAALWLGPDEWLLFAAPKDTRAITGELIAALAGRPHAVVDVSHRSAGIMLSGAQAAPLINHGCPLDLSLLAFPIGSCTRTVFERAGIILWRTEEQRFHLEIERSFAAYVWHLLVETSGQLAP